MAENAAACSPNGQKIKAEGQKRGERSSWGRMNLCKGKGLGSGRYNTGVGIWESATTDYNIF